MGNPRPPSSRVVAKWVQDAWRKVPEDVVLNFVWAAGFDAKHDVYGQRFCQQLLLANADFDSEEEISADFDAVQIDDELTIDDERCR